MSAAGRRLQALQSVAMIGAGAVLALTPAGFQAIGARTLSVPTQGVLALALAVGTFLGQVVGAWVVESRLATREDDEAGGEVPYPLTLLASAAAGAAVLVAWPQEWLAHLVGVPLLLASLVAGRLVSVGRHHVVREVLASAVLVLTLGLVALDGFSGPWAIRWMVLSATAAVFVRYVPTPRVRAVSRRNRGWVVADTTVAGIAQPLLNGVLLAVAGPQAAIAYRAVSTVSAAFEPVISYVRVRLLVSESRFQVALGAVTLVGVAGLLVGMDALGLFDALLGSAWYPVTIGALLAACGWRASTLVTTVPFARLRRDGRTRDVFLMRAASAACYLAIATPLALTGSAALVFVGLLVAEGLTAAAYWTLDRCSARAAVPAVR